MMTQTIQHHLTDALLMAYSAGTLPEAFSLVVASHVSLCDDCRARLGSFDAIGGNMIDSDDAAALADDSFEATLRRIEAICIAAAERTVLMATSRPEPGSTAR